MDWTIIDKITTHPAFLAALSILSIIGGVFAVLSKTSFGKKAITKLTDLVSRAEEKTRQTRELVEESIKQVEDAKSEIKSLGEEVKNNVKVYFSQLDFFVKSMYDILSQVPNVKVQEQLQTFISGWNEKKKEIENFIGYTYQSVEEKIEGFNNEKDRQIDALKGEIEILKELVNQALNNKGE